MTTTPPQVPAGVSRLSAGRDHPPQPATKEKP